MTVMVVCAKGDSKAGRQVANEIGRAEGQRAMLLLEKEYRSRESQIPSDQPVVFVGLSGPAEDLLPTTSMAFSKCGAECHIAGKRAILKSQWAKGLKHKDAREMAEELAVQIKENTGLDHAQKLAKKIPEPVAVTRKREGRENRSWEKETLSLLKKYSGYDLVEDYINADDIEERFAEIQYLWLASCFVKDYLRDFAAD